MSIKKCSINGCDSKVLARGWCSKHLSRFYNHGDPNKTLHKTHCTIEGCNRKHIAHGKCARHFEQERRKSGYHAKHIRTPKTRYTDCLRHARYKSLEWFISFEDYINLIKQKCFYCEGPLPETKVGLDRKNNNIGYTLDNVVPCCRYCNQLKSNIFNFSEFVEFSKTDLFKIVLKRLHNAL